MNRSLAWALPIAFFLVAPLAIGAADDAPLERIRTLVTSSRNSFVSAVPRVFSDNERGKRRNVPYVQVATPWSVEKSLFLELPEHAHGSFDDGTAFKLSGRDPKTGLPAVGAPRWSDGPDGVLSLAAPYEGGITLRFEVRPHDRHLEILFGVTNTSDQDLRDVSCQACNRFHELPGLNDPDPATTRMLVDGELVSWSSLGDGLTAFRPDQHSWSEGPNRGRFFSAFPDEQKLSEQLRKVSRIDLSESKNRVFARAPDLPLIVKTDVDDPGRHVVVYSPVGAKLMFNPTTPCMHVNPRLGDVPAGETRWVPMYVFFFSGDIGELRRAALG